VDRIVARNPLLHIASTVMRHCKKMKVVLSMKGMDSENECLKVGIVLNSLLPSLSTYLQRK